MTWGAVGQTGGPTSPAFPDPHCTQSQSTAQRGVRLALGKCFHWLQSLDGRLGCNGVSTARLLVHSPGKTVVTALLSRSLPFCPRKVLVFPALPRQSRLHRCMKIMSDQLRSLTASMAVFEESACIWIQEKNLSAGLPALPSPWGVGGWAMVGEVCHGPPPLTPWSRRAELACQVGRSAPGLQCGLLLLTFCYFSKHAAEYSPGHKKYAVSCYT